MNLNQMQLSRAANPCEKYNWLRNTGYRRSNCSSKPNRDICDKLMKPQWVRPVGDVEIVNQQVNVYQCATTYPIWMRGHLPMTKDTINATVCLNKGRMQYHGGCDDQMIIQVKNCTGYYVYYIQPPEVCNAAYCFGYGECPSFEPCDFYYHEELVNFDMQTYCDLSSGWYKLTSQKQLPTTCNEPSASNLWINVNGTSPENGEIIEAKLCYKYGSSCCDRYADLQMKNCSGSLVLNITSKPSCLCGGTCYSTLSYQYMLQGYT
ncbi:uncharacterized protein LOC134684559 [Mytilus trossulus]|uniref:uncharacterized protein LOC134684559 n=1 Tax=Mytilus trossulus TaxID=6551 RepID=UPI003005EF1E